MTTRTKIIAGIFAVLLILLVGNTYINQAHREAADVPVIAAGNPPEAPLVLLKRVTERQSAAKSFKFSMEVNQGKNKSLVDVYIQGTDRFAANFYDAKGKEGNILGLNGDKLWFYFRKENSVIITDLKEDGLNEVLSLLPDNRALGLAELSQNYDFKYRGLPNNQAIVTMEATPKRVGSTPVDIILNSLNKDDLLFKIDVNKLIILEETRKTANGNVVISYKNAVYDDSIPESTFNPPSVAIAEQNANMLYFILTDLAKNAGNWEMAELFNQKQLETIDPGDQVARFSITLDDAHYKYQQVRYQDAFDAYQAIMTEQHLDDKQIAALNYFVGLCQWQLNKIPEAMNSIKKLHGATYSTYYADAMLSLGRLYYESGDKQAAIDTLNSALSYASGDLRSEIQLYLSYVNLN